MTLSDYLKSEKVSVADFAKQVGKSRGHIYRVLDGEPCGPKLAIAIEGATSGNVTRAELRPDLFAA